MAKLKSSSLNTRNWRGAIFRDPVPDAMELARKVAGVELTEADRALLTEATERARARVALQQIQETGNSQREAKARARMSGRTIDETGKDVNERQPQPEPIRTGWYWTGRYTVWVVGPTVNGRGIYYQTATKPDWLPMRVVGHWQRVHEQVKKSGQGFGWRPIAPNH